MRGHPAESEQLFSYVRLEDRVPGNHPLRAIRSFVDPILRDLSPRFDAMYAGTGRPSIPPEQLIRALLLQMLYTIRRSECCASSWTTVFFFAGSWT
jgi:transposase